VGKKKKEELTVDQAAVLAGCSADNVRRWIRQGRLRATRPGHEYRIAQKDLQKLVTLRETQRRGRPRKGYHNPDRLRWGAKFPQAQTPPPDPSE
jgi:excisionase family DNA binding protein